jgi:hypothetical protein
MMLPELVKESHGFNRGSMSISDEEEVTGTCIVVSGNTQAEIIADMYDKMCGKFSDHGDRSGGLLIGYIGFITVTVALERTN